jgi:hypothetical protein
MPGLLKGQLRSPQKREFLRHFVPILWCALAGLIILWTGNSLLGRLAAWGMFFCFSLLQSFGPSILRQRPEPSEHATEGIRSRRGFRISVKILGCVVEATAFAVYFWATKYWQTYVSLFAAFLAVIAYFGILQWRRNSLLAKWREQGLCPECGYDWRSIAEEPRCPECGHEREQPVAEPASETTLEPAREPTRRTAPIVPPPPGRPVCARCGGNMRGREDGRICPDCGAMYGVEYIEDEETARSG